MIDAGTKSMGRKEMFKYVTNGGRSYKEVVEGGRILEKQKVGF